MPPAPMPGMQPPPPPSASQQNPPMHPHPNHLAPTTSTHPYPTYPSIDHSSQPPPHNFSTYQNTQGWGGPSYYAPQAQFHPRSFQNGHGNGYPRYNDNRHPQQHFAQSSYMPQYIPHAYPQMGGPGPATMQNGFGYQGEGVPNHLRGGYFQPTFEPAAQSQAPYQSAPADGDNLQAMNGQAPPDDPTTPQPMQPPPPNFGNPALNGFPHQPYVPFTGPGQPPPQQYFPPGHPYAHGGGFGYPPYQINGNSEYGFGFSGPGPQSQPVPQQGKGLNPAAAGFTFSGVKSLPNGHPESINAPKSPAQHPVDTTPVFASVKPELPLAPVANGHPESVQAWVAPVIVDGEKLKGLGMRRDSGDSQEGGLGLSQMSKMVDRRVAPAGTSGTSETATAVESATSTTQTSSTPAMTSPSTSHTPVSVQTPRATTDAEHSVLLSPPEQTDGHFNFVGPTMSGYSSPPATTPNTSLFQAISAGRTVPTSVIAGASKSRSKTASTTEPLRLASTRPDATASSGITYSKSLSQAIPKTVKVQQDEDVRKMKLSSKGREKASGKKVVFAVGTGDEPRTRGEGRERFARTDLIFGSAVLSAEQFQPTSSSSPEGNLTMPGTPAIAVPPSAPVPKTKPSSWAALLKSPSSTTPRSSVAPSAIPSPSKSAISLSIDTDAGPSQNVDPVTPKSNANKPLPPSTGAATTSSQAAPRPVFNYAAAAAAGSALTPQEELAKLLTDGVKGKGREVPVCVPRGLINTGNMCFANTVLQVLVYCPPFTELLEELGKRLKADLARRTPLLEAMIVFLREFTASLGDRPSPPNGTSTPKGQSRETRQDAFIPENVYDAMKENKRFDSMRRGYQEDAEEYLGFFLDTLHEELLYLLSRTQAPRPSSSRPAAVPNGNAEHDERQITRPVSPGADNDGEGWLEVGKKQKTNVVRNTETRESAISRIFGGTIRSVLHTPGQKDSVTVEPYQPLQLDISSPDVLTISDALRHISEPELVPGVWSQSRNANVDAMKQVYLETFPAVLILHLKRFVYDATESRVVKKGRPVAYGTELIIPPDIVSPNRRSPTPIKYRLFGVIYHHGASASGGHYTVSVSRQDTSGWIHFDDESHAPVPVEQVVVSEDEAREGRNGAIGVAARERVGYLLFYRRVKV